jgi:apolipoprotein N-acyltransferase
MRRLLLPLAGTLVLWASFPRVSASVLAWIALVPWIVHALERRPRQAALDLGLAGALFFGLHLSWIPAALAAYGSLPLWFAWLTLVALALYLGLYVAAFGGALSLLSRRMGPRAALLAPPLWVTFELLRSRLFTGFPWGQLGHSQAAHPIAIQVADFAGVYGISFCLVASATGLALWIRPLPAGPRWRPALGAAVLGAGMLGYGALRLGSFHQPDRPGIQVAVVQANIAFQRSLQTSQALPILAEYEALSGAAAAQGAQLIAWPESAITFRLGFYASPYLRERLSRRARQWKATLVFGSDAFGPDGNGPATNSAYAISRQGKILPRYDKIQLVPFAERLLLPDLLAPLGRWIPAIADFVPGRCSVVYPGPGLRFGVLICYEGIFPQLARALAQGGADLLISLTNDAWFGDSAAPHQHLAMTALRAVETRRYLLRAANSGISALVDPLGRIVARSDLFTPALVSGQVQPATCAPPYQRWGDAFAAACALLTCAALLSCWSVRFGRSGSRSRSK